MNVLFEVLVKKLFLKCFDEKVNIFKFSSKKIDIILFSWVCYFLEIIDIICKYDVEMEE